MDTVAAVADRKHSAQRHHQTAKPDPVHERLDIDTYRPSGGVWNRFAQRHIQVAQEAGLNGRLGHRHDGGIVIALFRLQNGYYLSVFFDRDASLSSHVVGPRLVAHAVETEL